MIKPGAYVRLKDVNSAARMKGKKIFWDPVGKFDDALFEVVEVIGHRLGDPKKGDVDHRAFLRCRRHMAGAGLHPDDPKSWDVWGWVVDSEVER